MRTSIDRDAIYIDNARLSPELKAVISHWIDYFIGKDDMRIYFKIGSQKVAVSHLCEDTYTIYYRQLVTDVRDVDIFNALDLYKTMLKGMD